MSGTEHTVDGQTRAETFPDPMITSNTAEDGTETLKKDSISPPADPVISKLKDEAAGVPDTASLSTDDMPTVMAKSPRATPLRIDSPGTRTPLIETPPMTDDLEENPLAERAPEKDKPEDDDTPVPPEDILTPPPGATFAPFPTSDKASDKASEHDDIPETSKEEAAESTPAAAPVDEAPKELSAPPPEAEETTEKPGEASLASEAPEEKSEEQQPLEQQHNTHVETIGSTQEPREELQIGDDNLSRAVEAGHPLAGVESDLLDDTTTLNDTATVDTEQTLAPSPEKAEEIPSEHASITPMVSKNPEESEKLAEQAKEADEHAPVAPSDFLRPEKTEEQEPEQEQPSEHASLVPQVSKDPEESEKLEEQAKEAEEAAPAASVGDEKPHEPESTPDNELADAPPPPHIPVEDLNETDDAIAVAAKEEEEAEDKSEAPLIADTGVVAEEAPPTEAAPSTAEQHVTEEQEKPIKLVEEQAPEEPAIAEEHPMETETKIQELAAATTVGAPAAAVLEHQRRSEEEDERPAEQELEKEDDAQNLTAGPIEGISKDEEGGITLGSGVSDPIAPTEASSFEKEEEKDDNKLGQGAALAGGAALAAAGVAAATQDDDGEKPTEEASPAPEEEQEKPSHNLLAGQMTPPAEVGTPRTQELVEAEEGHSTVSIPQETDVPLTDSNTLEAALNPTAEGAAIAVGEHVAEPADAPAAPAADEQPTEGEPQTPSALIPQQGGTGLASDILSRKGSERRESSAEYPPESFKQEAAQIQEPEAAVEETPEQAKEEEDDDNKTAKMAAAGVGATALGGAAAAAMFHDSEAQEPVQSKFYEHENDPVDIPPQDEKQIPHDGPVEAPLIAPTDAPLDGPLGTDESVVTDVSTVGAPTISGELESLDLFNEQRNQQEAEESPMELKQPPAEKPMEVSNEEFGRNTNEPTATETPAGAAPVEAVGVPVVSGDNEEDAAAFDRFGADTPMPEDNPSNSLDLAGAKEKVPEEISESQDEEISREEAGTPVIEKLEDPAEVEKNKHEEEEPVEEIIASSPTLERADEKDGHGHEEPEEHALDHKVEEEKEEKEEDKGLGDKIKEAAVATAGAVGLGALAHQLTKDDDEKEEQKEAEKTEEVTEAPKEDEPAAVQPTEQEAAGETAIVHDENAVPTEDLAEESAEKPVEHPVESSTTEEEAAPIHPTEKEAATEAQLAFAENAVPVASLAGRTVDEQPSTDSTTDLVSATEVAHAADDAGVAPEEGAEVHKEGDQVVVVPDHHEAVEAEPVSKAPAEEQPSTDSTAALVEATEVAHAADDAGVSPEEGAEVQKDESETPVVIPEHHEAVEAEPIAKPIEEEQIVDESSVLATSEEQPEELKKLEDDPELQREVEADPELAEQVHMPTADQIKHEEEEAHLREVVEMPTSDQIKHEEEEAALQEKVEMPTADQVTKEDEPTEAAAPEEHEAPKDVHFYQAPTDDKHVEEEPVVSKDVHYGETAKAPHEDTTEAKDEEHDHDKVAAAGVGAAALGAGALAVHELGDHKEEAPQVPVETTAPEEPGVEEPIVAPDAPEEKIEETQKDDLVAAAPEEEIKKDLVEDELIAAVAPEETKTEESVVEEKPTEVTEEPPKDASVAEPAAAAVAAEPETKDEEPEAKPEEPEASKEEALVEKAKDVSKDVAEDHSGAIAGTAAALGVAGGAAAAAMASKDDDKKDEKHDEEDDEEEEDEDHKDEDGKPKKRKSLLKRVKDKAKHALHRDHHEEEAKPKEHKEEEHKEDVAAAAPVEREAPVEEKTEEEPIAPTKEASTHHAGAGLAAAGTIGTLHEATKKAEEPEQPDTTTEMPMGEYHSEATHRRLSSYTGDEPFERLSGYPAEYYYSPETITDTNIKPSDIEPAPTLEGPTHEDHANASPDVTVLRSHPGQNIGESFVIPPADSGEGLVFDEELAKEIDATNRGDLSKEGAKEPEKPVEPIETPAAKAPEAPEETVPAPVDKTAEARPTTAEGPSDASEGHYALHKDDTPAEQTPAPESTPSSAAPATGSEDITPRVMGHETSTELLRKLYVSPEALDEAATNPSQTSSMKERGLLADDVKTQPAEESAEATTTSAAPVAAPEGSELRQRKEPPAATVEDEAGPSSKLDERPSSQAGTMTSTRQKNMMQAFWGVFFLGFFGGIGRFFTGMFGKKKV